MRHNAPRWGMRMRQLRTRQIILILGIALIVLSLIVSVITLGKLVDQYAAYIRRHRHRTRRTRRTRPNRRTRPARPRREGAGRSRLRKAVPKSLSEYQ